MATSKEASRKKLDQLFKGSKVGQEFALRGVGRSSTAASSMTVARGEQVGALRGDTAITVQSRQAQVLLTGREPTPERPQRVMGLMQFSTYLSQVSVAAKQDDPWADWMLVQVEERLTAAEEKLKQQQANLERVLGANPMIDIQVSASVKPLKISIGFATSHAYWVARVITQYDAVVRAVLTARHQALIDPDMSNLLMDDAAKLIRRVFETTVRYRYTGVTRADVVAGTAAAQQAVEKMGSVPTDILDRSRRAKFAPAIMTSLLPAVVSTEIGDNDETMPVPPEVADVGIAEG